MLKIIKFLKENWLIVLIVLLALFLRLFRISSYLTFLGDEGRDALVWLRMVRNGKFTLIGPQTSIGNMYLGPLYYYLMLPFYFVLGTVGPSIGVALFAGATTALLWFFGKNWFSNRVGLMSAFLYSISPVAIVLSHSSWNPNVMPFFSLLTIWGVWQFWQKRNFIWLPVIGICLSFAIQSHYLGVLLVPVVGVFWLITLRLLIKENGKENNNEKDEKDKQLSKFTLFSFLSFLSFFILTFVPLVWFDLRHNFINYHSFYKFFSERQTTVNLKAYKAIPQLWPLWQMLVTRLLSGTNQSVGLILSIFFAVATFISLTIFCIKKSLTKEKSLLLLLIWILFGLVGMGLYKQHIYDHYFGFLFPSVFLLAGLVVEKISLIKRFGKLFSFVIFLIIAVISLVNSPLRYLPNFQMQHTFVVSQKIIEEAQNEPFNLGMIAKQNYDAGYRYFLEKQKVKAQEIDAQRFEQTITEQLFVVCEEKDCQPIGHPQAEIANFGWAKIDQMWEFPWGVKLYKLIHNPQEKNNI